MADDTYLSPGASAVDAMNRFMLERERQKDRELARQHQSDVEKRQLEKDQTEEKMRQQEMDYRKSQQDEATKDKGYQRTEKRLNDMVPGDVPDPELQSDAQKYGLGFRIAPGVTAQPDYAGPQQNPDVPQSDQISAIQNAPAVPPTNIGTPAQRQVVKRETYLDTLMNDPDLDAGSKKALEYQRATGQAPPAGIFKMAGTTTDTQPLLRVDARGDKVEQFKDGVWQPLVGEPPKGAHWVQVQHPPASASGAADDEVWSDKAIETVARSIGKGAPWPPMGNGNKASNNRTRIANKLANYDKETDTFAPGGSGPDLATAGADYKANKDAIVKLQGIQAGVDAFAGTAERNAKSMREILGQVPDTGNEWANGPYRAVLGAFNNDALKKFQTYRESINDEYTRLLRTVGMTGGVTNAMSNDMKTIMSNSSTIPNILSALDSLTTEAKNRHDSYSAELSKLHGNIAGSNKTVTPGAAPAGKTRKRYDINGNLIEGQ